MKKSFLDSITTSTKVYLISPHLDDAVFSAYNLIKLLSKKTKVTIVNVFTKSGTNKSSFSAQAFLKQCGYEDQLKLFTDRRHEDLQILTKLKCGVINLGLTDALWRTRTNTKLNQWIGSLIPELSLVYPTYRFHIGQGRINPNDPALKQLESKLKNHVKVTKNTLVFCPLGIGKHVDHLITRDACKKAFPNLVYWTDYPYTLYHQPDHEFIKTNHLSNFSLDPLPGKTSAILAYKSQAGAIFKNKSPKLVIEKYYFHK